MCVIPKEFGQERGVNRSMNKQMHIIIDKLSFRISLDSGPPNYVLA